jgi:hypothetical protein
MRCQTSWHPPGSQVASAPKIGEEPKKNSSPIAGHSRAWHLLVRALMSAIATMSIADEAMPGTATPKAEATRCGRPIAQRSACQSIPGDRRQALQPSGLRCQALPRIAAGVCAPCGGTARSEEMPGTFKRGAGTALSERIEQVTDEYGFFVHEVMAAQ